ncbi:hypothetical protein ABL78_7608 [Leptomonas seymouri]|uniref:Uncharacterized protein n=1 Tax=Leptomonas seymouri TaxID=5684 RepID=A0A0N1I0D2_LEPSE|nr:hypothetical protein ABL78_7608 [Leptomonas seymouri]|eukprot:KPI83360.1 hypothetical protein ABL78_7608 [Leptomonas seymouri]
MTRSTSIIFLYFAWAIVVIFLALVITIFSTFREKRSSQRLRAGSAQATETPALPATVLVNSVNDMDAPEQRAAVLAATGNAYVYATVQPSSPEQDAWYVSQHAQIARGLETPPRGLADVTAGTAETGSPFSFAAHTGARRGWSESGEDEDSSPGAYPPRHTSGHRDTERHSTRATGRVRSSVVTLHPRPLDEPAAFVLYPSHPGSPMPLGVLYINPLAPTDAHRSSVNGQAGLAPSVETLYRAAPQHSSNAPTPQPSPHFLFAPPSRRDRQRHLSGAPINGTMTEAVDEVVDGCCCDEYGRRFSVQQAKDLYGEATYLQRATPVVVRASDDVDAAEGKIEARSEALSFMTSADSSFEL